MKLEELGVFRIPVPIPFRQAGGPANVYLLDQEQGFLMFDTGLGTEASRAALLEGLARTGHDLKQVNQIIISHGHIDHYGAAGWIQEQAGRAIPILIHPADADKVLVSGANWPTLLAQNKDYFLRLGVPPTVFDETLALLGRSGGLGRQLAQVKPLRPGTRFKCKHVTLEVHHMPGHTTGLCCLYEPSYRLFFSADHLLEHVSPNPLMELGLKHPSPLPFKPLVTYFQSLEKTRALDIDLVLPGHAEPFGNHREVIESLVQFYQRRQAKLLEALRGGALTVYQAMKRLFPEDNGFELILMISETLGNLEMLEHRGEIKRETHSGLIRFRLAGSGI